MPGTAAAVITLGAYAYGGAPLALKAATGAHRTLYYHSNGEECMHGGTTPVRRGRWPRALPYQTFPPDFNGRQHLSLAVAPPEPLEVD